VTQPQDRRWLWEITDENRCGAAGDLAKLFKNEGVRQPGVLAKDAPSPEATLMAREVIQNSWDAARELQSDLGGDAPEFHVEFIYGEREGANKRALVNALDLGSLAAQAAKPIGDPQAVRSQLGLKLENCIDHLDDDQVPLRVMQVIERGTTGMYGPWKQARSKMFLALVSVGYTKKDAGAGGSYGYGKAGLISASATRTVVAYSCFRPHPDEPTITHRLLGMTYWGQHEESEASYTGFARYGKAVGDAVVPFENEEADSVAESLGLTLRDAGNVENLGTTFLLIEPLVEPEDLNRAVARNWWPALHERLFDTTVRQLDATGDEIGRWVPRPKKDPALLAFIRGFEIATMSQDNVVEHEFRRELAKANVGEGQLPTGRLGLVADLQGWSYASNVDDEAEDTAIKHCSLVALVRGPRMVVEYMELSKGVPYVRGTFVADPAVDDLLRQTEPKAHDQWQTNALDSVDPLAPKVAKNVLDKIREGTRDFKKRLKPPPPAPGDVRLSVLQNLFNKLMTGGGPGAKVGPKAVRRNVSVEIERHLEVAPDGENLVMRAKVLFRLSDTYVDGDEAPVVAHLLYRFIEDGRAGRPCILEIEAPAGFTEGEPGRFSGTLTRSPSAFEVVSDPYSADWTARLTASCEIASSANASEEKK
jgi:hypothetical protein